MKSFNMPLNSKFDSVTFNNIYNAARERDKEKIKSLPTSIIQNLVSENDSPLVELAKEKDIGSVNFIMDCLDEFPLLQASVFGYAMSGFIEEIDRIIASEKSDKEWNLGFACLGLLKSEKPELAKNYFNRISKARKKEVLELLLDKTIDWQDTDLAGKVLGLSVCLDKAELHPFSHHPIAYLTYEWAFHNKEFKKIDVIFSLNEHPLRMWILNSLIMGYVDSEHFDKIEEALAFAKNDDERFQLFGLQLRYMACAKNLSEEKLSLLLGEKKYSTDQLSELNFNRAVGYIHTGEYNKAMQLNSDLKSKDKVNLLTELCYALAINQKLNTEENILKTLTSFSPITQKNIISGIKKIAKNQDKLNKSAIIKIELDEKAILSAEVKLVQIQKKMTTRNLSYDKAYLWMSQKDVVFWLLRGHLANNEKLEKNLSIIIISFIITLPLSYKDIRAISDKLCAFFSKNNCKQTDEVLCNLESGAKLVKASSLK